MDKCIITSILDPNEKIKTGKGIVTVPEWLLREKKRLESKGCKKVEIVFAREGCWLQRKI